MLEALEDRITPSTVTENAANAATLQTDLNKATAANTQYIINLTGASAAYNLTPGQQLTVSAAAAGSQVSIEGTGQVITGNGNRVFYVDPGAAVVLQDLTITGGSIQTGSVNGIAQGGGIYDSSGLIHLTHVSVVGNEVDGSQTAEGGGIYVAGTGDVTIVNSVIHDNHASGSGDHGASASGGGVYASGESTVGIYDSTLSNNIANGGQGYNPIVPVGGGPGGGAAGGGLYVGGSGWSVQLEGDMLAGNGAIGGNGGYGGKGVVNALGNDGGNGGGGGDGGSAEGGAAFFTGNTTGSIGTCTLTILNDLYRPLTDPSTMLDNYVQAGNGGSGGSGGPSFTANNSDGGDGGDAGDAAGGALYIADTESSEAHPITITLGNTTLYGNNVLGGGGGAGGAAGTGSGTPGTAGTNGDGSSLIDGGGLFLGEGFGNFTMFNSTVAKNTVNAGLGIGDTQTLAAGGGLDIYSAQVAVVLDNNTITQNTIDGEENTGSGIDDSFTVSPVPVYYNNLIQGNQSIGSSAFELDTGGAPLSNATNNFIGSISANTVSTTANIVGNNQVQLGGVVDGTVNLAVSSGLIYYPLLANTVSIGAGTTSVLSTIATNEGTTTAAASDEIGNPRATNRSIDLGAVQFVPPSPAPAPPAHAPLPAPASPPALSLPPLLAFFDSLLGGVETVNANDTETITDRFFGIPLLVSTFDSSGKLVSVDLFGFNITFLFG
jgi:hypothetical protein